MSVTDRASHAFLGEEFLTWLWFKMETEGGEFELSRKRTVGIALDDMLTFAPRRDDDTQQTLRKGQPARTPEARTALRNGCRLARARLVMAMDQRQWLFTLDGATMALVGLRLPEDDEEAESAEERSHDRVANLAEVFDLVRELYGLFLRERLRPEYLAEQGAQQANWMQQ